MIFFGIDPGASGGIAAVKDDGSPLDFIGGDASDKDILSFFGFVCDSPFDDFAVLEEVGAKPRIDAAGARHRMGASSAFSFGASYGRLSMALAASRIPFERVLPATWQAALRCRTKGDKRVSKARAQELFPSLRITLKNADAYLLAEYARRLRVLPTLDELRSNSVPVLDVEDAIS